MTTRILLADEYQIVRQELRTILEKEPDLAVVAEVDSGEAAVQIAPEVEPDVVILSLAWARFNKALDLVHQLIAAIPSAKVIALSMNADRRFILEVLKAGAIGYVLKEHAYEELAMAIRAVQAHKTFISQSIFGLVIQDYLSLLRDSEAHFRTIFESSSVGIALMDKECRIVDSNPALQNLLGHSRDELGHKVFTQFFRPEEAAECQLFFKDLMAGNMGPYRIEAEYGRNDGTLFWGRLLLTPLQRAGSEGPVAIVMLEDIDEQRQAEAKIQHYQEKLRSVAKELSLTEETERRRLATGFHDEVGQLLALVQIKLGGLRQLIPPDKTGALDETREIIGQIIRSTRSLVGELSPPILYELGFESAIEWLAEKFQELYGIQITVSLDQSPKPLSEEVQIFLFHVMRELLINIEKRAKPNNVTIFISRTDSNMELTTENKWAPELPLPTLDDLWLFSIRERLRYLGGSLEVESDPGNITRMSLVMPLEGIPPQKEGAKLEIGDQMQTAELARANESLLNELSQLRLTSETLQENEERYYRSVELSSEAIAIHSEGTFIHINPAGLKLLGVESPTQIVGRNILDIFHSDYREMARTGLIDNGLEKFTIQEQKILSSDGKVLDVDIVGIPITYLNKPAVQIIIKDISDRMRAEEALRESGQRLANIINFHPYATLGIDREGKVIVWNKAIEEMTGVKAEDMLGKDNYEYSLLFYGERKPILIDLVFKPKDEITQYADVTEDGLSLSTDTYSPMFRGREAYLFGKANILQDSMGNIVGAIEAIHDITQRLRAEAERLRFSKVESLGTLAGGIAHDFNNILAAIQGNISLALLDGKLEPKVRDKLARVEKSCQQARVLSQHLLTFAKGGAPIKKPVSIANLLKESAVATLSKTKSGCELSIPDDLWAVEVDKGQLTQVISNLLKNADQAMPDSGMINISSENILAEREADLPVPQGKYVKITIADEGIGISPEDLDKIFDPYFSDTKKGRGLGLAIVYSIIKKHDGYIKVESQAGAGTKFHIYLPATEIEVPVEEEEPTHLTMGQGLILVMDDEQVVRDVLGEMLGQMGYEAVFASDGAEAIEKFAEAKETGQPFAAVILDLTVPKGMGGKEAIKEILKIDPQAKAMVSSGYSDDPIMADYEEYGFREVIAKPYGISELSKALQRVIEGKAN